MEEIYINKVKYNLVNAKSEINNIMNILDEGIKINEDNFQKQECNEIYNDIDNQIDSLVYYIIPAVKNM